MRDDALLRFTAHELTRRDLQGLMIRSNGPALLRTVWHFGMLGLTGTVIWTLRTTGWVLPLIVIHGYMLAFVFCALHETAHRTAFRTRWLNVVVGHLAGFVGFWPYRNYRVYHWDHHRFTQDVERDPELYFAKPRTVPAYLFVLTGIPNAIRRIGDVVRLFAWNMPYHAEHHAYPAVPFHALPRLHAGIRGKIANLEPGYVTASVKVARHLFAESAAPSVRPTR